MLFEWICKPGANRKSLNYISLQMKASLMAQWVKNLPAVQEIQETRIWSLGQEKSPGEGNGNSVQYSCLESPMDRGAWQDTVYGVIKNQTWLSDRQGPAELPATLQHTGHASRIAAPPLSTTKVVEFSSWTNLLRVNLLRVDRRRENLLSTAERSKGYSLKSSPEFQVWVSR